MSRLLWQITILGLITIGCFGVAENGRETANRAQMEARLLFNLVGDNSSYNKHALPAHNASTPVQVMLSLSLNFIEDLDEESQTLYTNGWLHMNWQDINLQWNPEDYGGIGDIRIPPAKLWTPDITVYNSRSFTIYGVSDEHISLTAVVYSNGRISWMPPVRIATLCPMDLTHFPYDTQRCMVKFGSWTYSSQKLNLTTTSGSTKLYKQVESGNKFKLVNSDKKRNRKAYSFTTDEYVDIEYTLELKRTSPYTTHLVIVPTVALCLILPGMFLLPTGSRDKIIFGTGLMMTEAVMLVVLTDMLPTSHPTIPRLGIYHVTTLILMALSLAVSAFVSFLWNKGHMGGAMPAFLEKVVSLLGKMLFISRESVAAVGTYNQLELTTETGHTEADDEQMIPEKRSAGGAWMQLAAIIDRVCFLLFVLTCFISSLVFAFA